MNCFGSDCFPFSRNDFQVPAEGGLYLKRMISPSFKPWPKLIPDRFWGDQQASFRLMGRILASTILCALLIISLNTIVVTVCVAQQYVPPVSVLSILCLYMACLSWQTPPSIVSLVNLWFDNSMSAAHVGFFFHGQNPCIVPLTNTIVVTICLAHHCIFIHSNEFQPFPALGPRAFGGQFFDKIIFLNECVERCLCLANTYSTCAWDTQYSDFAYFHLPQISERVCLPYL